MSDERPCNNCGDPNWAAKNDNFCTSCEREWYRIMKLIFRSSCNGENPEQAWVDSVFYGELT